MDRFKKHELRIESERRTLGEIAEQKAATLARVTRTLERHVDRARLLRANLMEGSPAARTRTRLAEYESARRTALLWRWYLQIQREVLGLPDTGDIERAYPVPGPISD